MPPDGTAPDFVTRSHGLHVRAVRDNAREADFVASTDTVDSYDEVIDQSTWRLERYKANPVVLYAHNSFSELPIGQSIRCEVVNNQLECTIRFASAEANPRAEEVWKLVQERVLRAVSVGFKPMTGNYELRDGKEVFVLSDCDLREISVVAIPANPDALATMKAASPRASRSLSTTNERSTASDPTKEKFAMNEKELREALEKSEKALVDARAAEKSAADKASTEAARAGTLDAKVKTLETETTTLKGQIDSLTKEKSTLTEELTKTATARDAATKSAGDATAQLIEIEVEALVGKKIAPVEKESFVKLRKDSPELFTSMIANRPDMKLDQRVTAPDQKAAPNGVPVPGAPVDGGTYWNKL